MLEATIVAVKTHAAVSPRHGDDAIPERIVASSHGGLMPVMDVVCRRQGSSAPDRQRLPAPVMNQALVLPAAVAMWSPSGVLLSMVALAAGWGLRKASNLFCP